MEPTTGPMAPGGLVGRMVGGFVLESLLGAGGMAEVYRGMDVTLAREVAVKVLPEPLAHYPVYVARFRDEARAIAALASPHIVPIYQYGEDDSLLYLVMPILPDSLRGKLQREGPPPIETAVRLVGQVAEALEIAHAAGIVHRDVKPENILLDAQNQPLLSDFGIARDLADPHASDAGRALTATGTLIGTPQYMAPEQLRQQPADQRSDVYSLGVVLYELLTGRLPHAASTPYEVVARVLTQPVEPPSVYNPAVWPALDLVTLTALAADPAARYHSARDFALSLRAALADERQPTAMVVASRGTANPTHASASRSAVTELAAAAPAAAKPPRPRKTRPLVLVGLAALLVVALVLAGTLALRGGAGAPGLALLPLPGLAAARSSPTTSGSPSGTGAAETPGATTTPGGTPGTAPRSTPSAAPTGSPSPSASPTPTGTPPTPSLAISPSSWQLALSQSAGDCTSVPSDTGGVTVSQKITNDSGSPLSWQWQNPSPKLPDGFQYQLNGGLWSLAGAMPSDLLLLAGATDTLNVRLSCSGTQYALAVVARNTLSPTPATYTITLQVPGLP